MALLLKQYQRNSLKTLSDYLALARSRKDPDVSFYEITRRVYRTLPGFPGPYVCLRVPTGGGKTIMAAHAIGIVTREYLDRKSTRLNSSHLGISYAVFCLKQNTSAPLPVFAHWCVELTSDLRFMSTLP